VSRHLLDRARAGRGFGDELVAQLLDDRRHQEARAGLVIDDENADGYVVPSAGARKTSAAWTAAPQGCA
jgi:hypothetical protein